MAHPLLPRMYQPGQPLRLLNPPARSVAPGSKPPTTSVTTTDRPSPSTLSNTAKPPPTPHYPPTEPPPCTPRPRPHSDHRVVLGRAMAPTPTKPLSVKSGNAWRRGNPLATSRNAERWRSRAHMSYMCRLPSLRSRPRMFLCQLSVM